MFHVHMPFQPIFAALLENKELALPNCFETWKSGVRQRLVPSQTGQQIDWKSLSINLGLSQNRGAQKIHGKLCLELGNQWELGVPYFKTYPELKSQTMLP